MLGRYATRHYRSMKLQRFANNFSSAAVGCANRAIVWSENGNPAEVVRVQSYDSPPPPPPGSLNIRFRLSPINPSDVNVIQGVYPAQPTRFDIAGKEVSVGGNEGVAQVLEVGDGVKGFQPGDRVVVAKSHFGSWSSSRTVSAEDVIKLPGDELSEVNAATIIVNPPTAYNMLHEFVELKEGDWILQNGANSAVGQAVIQIAARMGIKTINFVRNRPDIDNLTATLTEMGATHVFSYDALGNKNLAKQIKQWTSERPIRLMLNCLGGPETMAMTRFIGENAHLVSYGAMSKKPLSLPTSAFIFKDLTAHGFWQNQWYKKHTRTEREALMRTLTDLKLKEPAHEIVDLSDEASDGNATQRVREVFARMEGGYSKKVLLRLS